MITQYYMESPNPEAKIMTLRQASAEPQAVNPSSEDRCPSWNTHTSAPNVAPSDKTFMTIALSGMSTEPVIKNNSAKVASAIQAAAYGARLAISALKSASDAAEPVT